MAQDLNGTVAALSQGAGAPLGHPAPIQTLHLPAVTVLGQDGLAYARAGQVVVKNLIHNDGDAFINIASGDPLMVKGRGGGNGKVIAAVPVMLCVDPIQRKTHDGQDIGRDGSLGPGGVDLAGGHIFDVIPVGYVIIPGICCGRPVMDHDGLGDHHAA